MKSIVAINRFATDTDEELAIVKNFCLSQGFDASICDFHAKGGAGGLELAEHAIAMTDKDACRSTSLYDWNQPVEEKIFRIASEVYGAQKVGYDKLPICIAKTQKSLSDNPDLLGRPKDFLVTVREILISSGAGFLVPITGEIMRMPGLPKHPSAEVIDVEHDGNISGLF
jgi:formate--tetrahydrofolate ligase